MTLEFSEQEHAILKAALWCSFGTQTASGDQQREILVRLYLKLCGIIPSLSPAIEAMSGTEAARAILAPPSKILWADGKPKPQAERRSITILAIQRKDAGDTPRLLLKTKTGTLSLWDENLFDLVASRVNIPSIYFVLTTADGKYTNVVGTEKP